jgi:hypothetical protein
MFKLISLSLSLSLSHDLSVMESEFIIILEKYVIPHH